MNGPFVVSVVLALAAALAFAAATIGRQPSTAMVSALVLIVSLLAFVILARGQARAIPA